MRVASIHEDARTENFNMINTCTYVYDTSQNLKDLRLTCDCGTEMAMRQPPHRLQKGVTTSLCIRHVAIDPSAMLIVMMLTIMQIRGLDKGGFTVVCFHFPAYFCI